MPLLDSAKSQTGTEQKQGPRSCLYRQLPAKTAKERPQDTRKKKKNKAAIEKCFSGIWDEDMHLPKANAPAERLWVCLAGDPDVQHLPPGPNLQLPSAVILAETSLGRTRQPSSSQFTSECGSVQPTRVRVCVCVCACHRDCCQTSSTKIDRQPLGYGSPQSSWTGSPRAVLYTEAGLDRRTNWPR